MVVGCSRLCLRRGSCLVVREFDRYVCVVWSSFAVHVCTGVFGFGFAHIFFLGVGHATACCLGELGGVYLWGDYLGEGSVHNVRSL